ncbi:5-dehydro-4-deoxyglucarate dehydratase [Pseudonocardia sp. TRM90224]|uniref:5-dehydro-4-deoxyglucarate dehydratase n=1 Tax=Pseudonocardia sp. TRM90224 TaxID=2812678 RepID=UPI0027E10A2A|nr:5-dehydro-4-deoxyglucarate dehydratase [Pseudonocardia sp. TRM90224]
MADAAARLREAMGRSVLSFPLTSFTEDGEIDIAGFRDHVGRQVAAGPAALFVCCGTGEFFSLAEPEYEQLLTAAVAEVGGRVPVVAGLGYGWAQASRFAAAAERAGVDAGLLMPHYLVEAPQLGLVAQVREVAARTALPLIVYQRGQVRFSAAAIAELGGVHGVIGLKDGHSDLDQLQRARLAAPPDWLFFNGAATAEMQARAYRTIGVPAYSSAVHSFAPEIASAFFRAFAAHDDDTMEKLLRGFYWPLVELRDRRAGYAVSLVKAAARLRGERVGRVRAPLTDPTPDETTELEALLDAGLGLVGATR